MSDEEKKKRSEKRMERIKNAKLGIWKFFNAVRMAVFPRDITCDLCGDELVSDTRYNLCAECMSKLPTVGEHVCLVCGVTINDEADFCIRCENTEYEFTMNCAPLIYKGVAKQLILALKYGNKKYIANTLGAMMADEFLKRGMTAEIAVYVPMTEWEDKKRGFNQSELLAREVTDRLGLPLLPALVKTKDTFAQKQLSLKERAENLKDAFCCVYDEVKGRNILLIDDVFTSGATANACAHALFKRGAREVNILTAAVTERKIAFESADNDSLNANAESSDAKRTENKVDNRG